MMPIVSRRAAVRRQAIYLSVGVSLVYGDARTHGILFAITRTQLHHTTMTRRDETTYDSLPLLFDAIFIQLSSSDSTALHHSRRPAGLTVDVVYIFLNHSVARQRAEPLLT